MRLLPDGNRPGQFVGNFRVSLPGTYRLELPVPESQDRDVRKIDVILSNLESSDPRQNAQLLRELVRDTGGVYLTLDEAVGQLAQRLPNRGETYLVDERLRTLWDRQWVMYLLIGLLSLEWLMRKTVETGMKTLPCHGRNKGEAKMPERTTELLHSEIASLLRRLKRRIRRYLALAGAAALVVVLAVLFWASVGLDVVYFKISLTELPLWPRAAFSVVAMVVTVFALLAGVVMILMRRFRPKALALVLERQFPELNDRLVTAVEFAESPDGINTPLARAMLDKTIAEATQTTTGLKLDEVFNTRPLRRLVGLAGMLVAGIVLFAWGSPQSMARWQAGYLKLEQEYWTREYGLQITVLAQPGDVHKEFLLQHDSYRYKHPRGDDLMLLVEVPDNKKVPDRVRVRYRLPQGRGVGRASCSRVGPRQFRFAMAGLLNDLELRFVAGDYTNRRPYRIDVVPPPKIDSLTLSSLYPAYTRLTPTDETAGTPVRDPVAVRGTQVSLPMDTQFDVVGRVNKPLIGVLLQTDRFDLWFGHRGVLGDPDSSEQESEQTGFRALLTLKAEDGQPQRRIRLGDLSAPPSAEPFLSSDGRSFQVPFVLATEAETRLANIAAEHVWPLAMPADSILRVYLEDTDDIVGSEPARVTIHGIVDQPPVVETELMAIGTSITRKATIPVSGIVTDDYGITAARFEYRIDDSEHGAPRPFRHPPQDEPREFQLQRRPSEPFERFDVFPLGLSVGQELTLSVFAQDADDVNGPHIGHGQRYRFQIVSTTEMLSILHQKELNLRKRFEQIISDVKGTRQDVILHRTRIQERRTLVAAGPKAGRRGEHQKELQTIDTAVTACAERALHAIRKNANETISVEQSFRDLRDEMVNNAVDTSQMLSRIDNLIVAPLHAINVTDYPTVDEALGEFKLANELAEDPTSAIDACVDDVTRLIERMERVLREMRKLETFQEALEMLKGIIEQQEQLIEKTKQEQKKRTLDKLKGLGIE